MLVSITNHLPGLVRAVFKRRGPKRFLVIQYLVHNTKEMPTTIWWELRRLISADRLLNQESYYRDLSVHVVTGHQLPFYILFCVVIIKI